MVNNVIENGAKILNRNFTKDDVKIFNFNCNKGNANYNHVRCHIISLTTLVRTWRFLMIPALLMGE